MINFLKFITKSLKEVFAPKICVVCEKYFGDTVSYSEFICNKCYDSIPYCPSKDIIYNNLLMAIKLDDLFISNASSLFQVDIHNHRWLEIIHLLKYKGITKIGTEFGELLGKRIAKEGFADYDYVIPVPIHQSKKRERGYNQSEFIAKSVAKILNCNYNSQLLKRKKYTNSQTLLDTTERKKNIQNVFASYNDKAVELVNGKDILIVDDVLTTGSTINECARILINMGANSVDVATLGHA